MKGIKVKFEKIVPSSFSCGDVALDDDRNQYEIYNIDYVQSIVELRLLEEDETLSVEFIDFLVYLN